MATSVVSVRCCSNRSLLPTCNATLFSLSEAVLHLPGISERTLATPGPRGVHEARCLICSDFEKLGLGGGFGLQCIEVELLELASDDRNSERLSEPSERLSPTENIE